MKLFYIILLAYICICFVKFLKSHRLEFSSTGSSIILISIQLNEQTGAITEDSSIGTLKNFISGVDVNGTSVYTNGGTDSSTIASANGSSIEIPTDLLTTINNSLTVGRNTINVKVKSKFVEAGGTSTVSSSESSLTANFTKDVSLSSIPKPNITVFNITPENGIDITNINITGSPLQDETTYYTKGSIKYEISMLSTNNKSILGRYIEFNTNSTLVFSQTSNADVLSRLNSSLKNGRNEIVLKFKTIFSPHDGTSSKRSNVFNVITLIFTKEIQAIANNYTVFNKTWLTGGQVVQNMSSHETLDKAIETCDEKEDCIGVTLHSSGYSLKGCGNKIGNVNPGPGFPDIDTYVKNKYVSNNNLTTDADCEEVDENEVPSDYKSTNDFETHNNTGLHTGSTIKTYYSHNTSLNQVLFDCKNDPTCYGVVKHLGGQFSTKKCDNNKTDIPRTTSYTKKTNNCTNSDKFKTFENKMTTGYSLSDDVYPDLESAATECNNNDICKTIVKDGNTYKNYGCGEVVSEPSSNIYAKKTGFMCDSTYSKQVNTSVVGDDYVTWRELSLMAPNTIKHGWDGFVGFTGDLAAAKTKCDMLSNCHYLSRFSRYTDEDTNARYWFKPKYSQIGGNSPAGAMTTWNKQT